MEYLKRLLKAARESDLYPDMRRVDDVPYPELVIEGERYVCFCSNNYLGLSIHPEVKKAAIEAIRRYGIGTCESRLIAGNLTILEELEEAIADFKQVPDAMIFLSGFMANIGIIPALMDSFEAFGLPTIKNEDNLIIKDALAHMSIVDGCRLSRSPTKTYLHNDMDHLEKILKRSKDKRKLIVTDGIFSMDGDLAPLPEIISLARTYNAMVMIDDAHATGVLGENGRGTPEHFGVEGEIDLIMGTLSKAVGALGGYLTGPSEIIDALRMRAHSYIFSSSLPPEQACGIMAALKIIQNEPERRADLWKNVHHLRTGLENIGFNLLNSETQIIPVLIGDENKGIQMSRLLLEKGIIAPLIGWPAVASGMSRIRCTVMATHTRSQIDQALAAFQEVGERFGIVGRSRADGDAVLVSFENAAMAHEAGYDFEDVSLVGADHQHHKKAL
ncbi:8-amino-7-oxononanoate synthase [Candidatus Poribacteria bacterium]